MKLNNPFGATFRCATDLRRRTLSMSTVDLAVEYPSRRNSDWVRGVLHVEFSNDMRPISLRVSAPAIGQLGNASCCEIAAFLRPEGSQGNCCSRRIQRALY